ncbi:MAG TPA: thioredoxin domain-containing protein [Candidatus Nanopelagicales bacterium]
MPNRLAEALSPYLLQHADNPVDWWPWCDEAFAEARRRDVPILLSVGYAACHWCHVMAHESFEDPATAQLLNAHYVSIKVDREERPDIDSVYMTATQALTGHGGWPMTVFLDHEGRAFHAGTYFPPVARGGMPAFADVLRGVAHTWRTNRPLVHAAADQLEAAIARHDGRSMVAPLASGERGPELPGLDAIGAAVDRLGGSFDAARGGFGGAPKFPPSLVLEFLLRADALGPVAGRRGRALEMAGATLAAMARGGMYDQLAGGFARYSVDADWVVPHFEKMLYDNALLLRAYLHWWRATGDQLARRVVEETAGFLLDELRTPEGGFASALDADSAEGEGAFAVWTRTQLVDVLGDQDGAWVAAWCEVTERGTFEHGASVLQLRADPDDPARWARCRSALLAARRQRPQPARDDKVVAAWNGLAIAALAEAGALLARPAWVAAARGCAQLLLDLHRDPASGRLARVSRGGIVGTHAPGVLEDHADVAEGLLALYQVTGEVRWFHAAQALLGHVLAHFGDGSGGFHDTADDAPALVRRPVDPTDGVAPSGWSAAAQALLTSAALGGPAEHRDAAEAALRALVPLAEQAPRYAGWAWSALAAVAAGPSQVAVIVPDDATILDAQGLPAQPLHRAALASPAPGLVVAVGRVGSVVPGLLADRTTRDGLATAYPCRGFVCDLPTTQVEGLRAALEPR